MQRPTNSKPSGQRTPSGNVTTAGGGGFTFDNTKFINLQGSGIPKKIKQGKLGGNLTQQQRDNILKDPTNVTLDNLNPFLLKEANQAGKKIKLNPIVTPTSEPESLDAYNTLRDSEIERLKSQQGINKQIMGMFPALLQANSGAVNKFSSMVDQGFTELDPAINSRIDKGVQGYIGNATNNFKDAYSRIADGFVNDIAQGGVGGFGAGEGFKQQVTEPLSRDLSNIVNQAEVYRGQLTNDALNNQRAGVQTLASSTPALNQILQGLQMPVNQVNPAAINPTGNFDPAMLAQMLQFTNTFQANRDDKAMEPWMLELQAELQKQIAASQQGNGWGNAPGAVGGALAGAVAGPAGAAVGTKIGSNIVDKFF
jgi:hypothetical protein